MHQKYSTTIEKILENRQLHPSIQTQHLVLSAYLFQSSEFTENFSYIFQSKPWLKYFLLVPTCKSRYQNNNKIPLLISFESILRQNIKNRGLHKERDFYDKSDYPTLSNNIIKQCARHPQWLHLSKMQVLHVQLSRCQTPLSNFPSIKIP